MSDQEEMKNNDKKLDTVDEQNNDEDQNVEIIYKKEKNPIVKFLLGFLIFVVTAYVVLFATGFIMGWMGIRPPSLDNNVITNQWEKVTGQTEDDTEPPSEVQKKTPDNKNKETNTEDTAENTETD